MSVTFEEKVWTVRRQAAVAAGALGVNEAFPKAPTSGLFIRSDKGDQLFLPIEMSSLPTEDDVREATIDQFIAWLRLARARAG